MKGFTCAKCHAPDPSWKVHSAGDETHFIHLCEYCKNMWDFELELDIDWERF